MATASGSSANGQTFPSNNIEVEKENKSIMDFNYYTFNPTSNNLDLIDLSLLNKYLQSDAVKGIFSFSVYLSERKWGNDYGINAFDNNRIKYSAFNIPGIPFLDITNKNPLIYFLGIWNYLEMIRLNPDKWAGWIPIIYTDMNTIMNNQKAFMKLGQNGAAIGMTKINTPKYDLKPILRINRFYPLFMEGVKCPVFVRDADTIFEYEMARIIKKERTPKTWGNKGVVDISNPSLPEFIQKLNKWESAYYDRIKRYENKVIFSYDNNYFFSKGNDKKHVRIMAGIVSKLGDPLPIQLWNQGLPMLIDDYLQSLYEKYVKSLEPIAIDIRKRKPLDNGSPLPDEYRLDFVNPPFGILNLRLRLKQTKDGKGKSEQEIYDENKAKYYDELNWTDEVYLTNVIYEWCKTNGRAELFKMNLRSDFYKNDTGAIRPSKDYLSIIEKYFSKKYPASKQINNKGAVSFYFSEYPAENKQLAEYVYSDKNFGLSPKSKYWTPTYETHSKVQLNHPNIALNDDYFFNPLTGNDASKPATIPNYVWGGKKSNKTKQQRVHKSVGKRKTRKNRK